MGQDKIKSLITPLEVLLNFLSDIGVKNIIIGGIAASLLGKARFTADIDSLIFLAEDNLESFLKKAAKYDLLPRIANAIEFARKNRVFLLKHKPTGINIDLSLAILPFEIESLKRARIFKVGKLKFHLPTAEDLIIMKAVAHRAIDMQDIRSIMEVNPNLDSGRIKYWVKEFAKVLEMPDIFDDLVRLLPRK